MRNGLDSPTLFKVHVVDAVVVLDVPANLMVGLLREESRMIKRFDKLQHASFSAL